jgi:hypothetical protein
MKTDNEYLKEIATNIKYCKEILIGIFIVVVFIFFWM